MPSKPALTEPSLGFVVIGRNEGERLGQCLAALSAYAGRIVYADSASTDGSPELAAGLGATVVELSPDRPMSAARGRNAGFEALRGLLPDCEFVQFIDGDSIVQPGWVDTAVAYLRANARAAVVCGACVEEHPDASIYNWLCNDEWNTPVGQAEACGGNAMMRAEAVAQAGGFRGDLRAGEEAELTRRMIAKGWEVWRIDAPMVVHDANILTFGDWWRRAERGGYAFANTWSLTAGEPRPLYQSQLKSALVWAVLVPASIALAAAVSRPWLLLAIPAAYALQVSRIAARRGWSADAWRRAAMLMLAKLPEATGIIRFILSRRPAVRASGGNEPSRSVS